ncbi:SURF1 family protein [Marinobacterium sediminicola]|uniref:SURF1-like protein n=1 Tax=Marinobacterium sediminicola TaxID=518898 RepID=A0ABY1S4V2_9GAMM|nr:SURF1 family protein [Marinobacterium sediminicola]ULG68927.1 SURF1 family protein [Marinobacterium sediminicola]SMR78430.1 Cytochrome oxidase assembly protein ShyY1 [Marinobacterium sediminicola]
MANTSSKADSRRRFKRVRLLLWLLGVPLLSSLGAWQLQRADQKETWLQQLQDAPATTVTGALERLEHYDWVPVRFEIELVPIKVFLLDNRTWRGRVGYEVVVPVRVDEGNWWLGSLGWIAAPPRRDQLPDVQLVPGWRMVEGVLSRPFESVTLAASQMEAGWPRRMQSMDLQQIREALAVPVEPLVLHLKTAVSEMIMPRENIYTGVEPQRHIGYAVQWFGLALALAIWLVWVGRRERREVSHEQ